MASNEKRFGMWTFCRRTGDRKTKSVDLSSSEVGEGEGEGEYVVKHINARRPERVLLSSAGSKDGLVGRVELTKNPLKEQVCSR